MCLRFQCCQQTPGRTASRRRAAPNEVLRESLDQEDRSGCVAACGFQPRRCNVDVGSRLPMMLLICENCGVFVHQNWEFCRRCGSALAGAQAREPRLVPRIPIERLPHPQTALQVPALFVHSLKRLWAPVEARLSAQQEHWPPRADAARESRQAVRHARGPSESGGADSE
jgi:hypothetical protein